MSTRATCRRPACVPFTCRLVPGRADLAAPAALAVALAVLAVLFATARPAAAQDFEALRETRPPDPLANVSKAAHGRSSPEPRVLIAGDSWAQYMWDDGSHNDIFDRYGHDDHRALSRSLQDNPGPGYSGPEYAVSGSEAREWADTANFPWIANVVAELDQNPTIDTVILSIGGNDILRGRSGGGWYKDMDLDVPGSEAALFQEIHDDTFVIIDAILAVRPDLRVVISSYDYPNFNVGFWCFIYACPKRRDLSRDPETDLITDEELNALMIEVETLRIDWANSDARVDFDNGIGAMHHYYGDGQSPPGVLPLGGQEPPLYLPFPGGNPLLPTLRENFRQPGGIDADPIHLDYEGYQYKITHETNGLIFPRFRGQPDATVLADGGDRDGWTDGVTVDTSSIMVGDDGTGPLFGIVSFDTSSLPDGATVTGASFYLMRHDASGANPFMSGALGVPVVDVARGGFGAPELEPADATAPATAADAGVVVGSVRDDGYALRVDLEGPGLAAVATDGLTQVR
ncbi:MAG: hypothetical protein PVF43_13080, partial [Candidatus Eiseniibacteriota bacterium]